MGRAIEMGLREQFIALKQAGYSLHAISEELHLCYGTVCHLSARLKKQGNLAVHYQNCGAKEPTSPRFLVRAALWLKRHHPDWGAPFIRLQLCKRYGEENMPVSRSLQRWFRSENLSRPRQQKAEPRIGTAKAPHNIWQVDAKENLTLCDHSAACYLTITDEHSGAGLAGPVFPPKADRTGGCCRSSRQAPGGF